MIIPLSNIVHNENVNYTKYNGQISDKSANNMPNGLLRVSEIPGIFRVWEVGWEGAGGGGWEVRGGWGEVGGGWGDGGE